jgi:hypothetical protein
MTDTRNPLDGPFMSAKALTDSSDMPGYAIPAPSQQLVLQRRLRQVRTGLQRAGADPALLTMARVMGIYNDWMSDVAGRHTAESLEAYAERLGRGEF